MIERVTKAVRVAREMSLCSLCDSRYRRTIRCSCEEIARAAIEAMREPTNEMEEAGNSALSSNGVDNVESDDSTVCFQAMIDATLSRRAGQ